MKLGLLVTGRLKSTRLPRKALLTLGDRPLVVHLFDRLKRLRHRAPIVLCTSTLSEDDELASLARQHDVDVFRGDPDDVLRRLTDTAEHYEFNHVVSCTADNPFVDAEFADALIDYHLSRSNDYSASEGLPFGTFCYVLARKAMVEACAIKDEADTEVWGGYFTMGGRFKTGVLSIDDPAVRRPSYRLTVDTPDDFRLAEAIVAGVSAPHGPASLREIVQFLDRRPDLVASNQHVVQRPGKPIRFKAVTSS